MYVHLILTLINEEDGVDDDDDETCLHTHINK
jgi:hypothetical protein